MKKPRPFNASQPAQVTPKVQPPSESWWTLPKTYADFTAVQRLAQARMNGTTVLEHNKTSKSAL